MKSVFFGLIFVWGGVFSSPNFSFADPLRVTTSQAKVVGENSLGVGTAVELTYPGQATAVDGLFLGRVVPPAQDSEQYLFLDLSTHQASLVSKTEVEWSETGKMESVINPYPQVGGTCAGYAIFHYLNQLSLSGVTSAPALTQMVATEQGRTQLLAQSLDSYYIEGPDRTKIKPLLDHVVKDFGLKCNDKTFADSTQAIDFVKSNLAWGNPVLIEFFVGNEMTNADDQIVRYGATAPEDIRIWTPRQRGVRNSGGHAVVLAASFMQGSEQMVVVIDSDWDAPRIWNLEKYLSGNTALPEIEFHTCQ